ncbi:MAG: dihydrolipoyl dehydrogenase, partial [Deltaproteobacteria bacterium]|nr:dihydrolipoyl dehydrogenase [Deltaproteobacteria bacterium]MBW2323992.1 dihydrolipoyl dehydrogenase [Deltaproteobacteria bacterium]
MTTKITIIGSGPGGYIGAIRAAQLGADVTLIENDRLGGTCLNWGCIPTKALRATAEVLDKAQRLSEFGIELKGEIRPDIKAIMRRKQKIVETMVTGIKKIIDSYKIQFIKGTGYVIDPGLVRVEEKDGSTCEVTCDRLILASGSSPLSLPVFPVDGQKIISSNDALLLEEIPEEMIIVGGGVVGAEFGFIFNALGTRVTIVEALDRVVGLPSVDEACSKVLAREMKKKKIKLYLNKTVTGTEDAPGNKVSVTLGPSPFLKEVREKDRKELSIVADKILVSIGRELNTRNMGLNKIGLEIHPKGWVVANERMETNIPGVYAVGDILGPEKIMLAHAASSEAEVAVENCMGGQREMSYDVVPGGIFTFPEIASVGLTEAQTKERGLDFRSDNFLFRGLGKPQAMGEIAGQVKI